VAQPGLARDALQALFRPKGKRRMKHSRLGLAELLPLQRTISAMSTAAGTPDLSPLFQPFRLRSLVIDNRFVMSPMTREHSAGGVPGADMAGYYARRAAGGTGLIVTEGVGIDHPYAVDTDRIPRLHGADALTGWRAVTDAVHAAGGKIVPQLWHQGPLYGASRSTQVVHPGLRPSGLWGTPGLTSYSDDHVRRVLPPTKPMSDEDIADVIAAYARSARHAVEAGFDGIAVHGAHGYLIDTFFWSDTNRRTDRYGGDARARARFGVEVVRAIRATIGDSLPIVFRFSQHKQQDYNACFANSPQELGLMLGLLADAGVDLFDASSRRFNRPAFEGSDRTLAGWARHLTGKPSMTVGGIGLNNWLQDTLKHRSETQSTNNLPEVLALFERGMFDLVGVGRALLNDAGWTDRLREGEHFRPYDPASLSSLT
jgi:2,4-dienoyl-CoA reductase-like NADH-dependent reductase (Old Yellow Enzyme family)